MKNIQYVRLIQLRNSHFRFKQLAPTWTVVSLIKKEKKNKITAGRRWAWGQVHSSPLPHHNSRRLVFPFFPVLPSPLEATSPTQDNSMIVWSLHPHVFCFFFETSGAAWTWRGVGDRILHKLHWPTVYFRETAGFASLPWSSWFSVNCQPVHSSCHIK